MRKLTATLLTIIMLLSFIGCSFNNQNSGQETSQSIEITTHSNTSETNAPVDNLEKLDKRPLTEYLNATGDTIVNSFGSIEDLETYIDTGSVDPSDYPSTTNLSFENFPKVDSYETNEYIKQGYTSLEKLLGITKIDLIESVNFKLIFGGIEFNYYLKNNLISVTYAPCYFSNKTASDFYSEYCKSISKEYSPYTDLSVVEKNNQCYISRSTNNNEVVYTVNDNALRSVRILTGNYMIYITSAWYSDAESVATDFKEFMESPDLAPLSVMFSEDDQVFNQAVTKIVLATK